MFVFVIIISFRKLFKRMTTVRILSRNVLKQNWKSCVTYHVIVFLILSVIQDQFNLFSITFLEAFGKLRFT